MKFIKQCQVLNLNRYLFLKLDVVDELYTQSQPNNQHSEDEFDSKVDKLNEEDFIHGPYGPESILDDGNLVKPENLVIKIQELFGPQGLETKEGRELLATIIQDSVDYLRQELDIQAPQSFMQEVGDLFSAASLNPQKLEKRLKNFIGKAQISAGKMTKSSPWVCAFLKIASAALHYHQSPKLKELDSKTDDFSAWFCEKGHFKPTNKKIVIKSVHGPSVPVLNIHFRAKTKFSIFSKLIRKPGDSAQTIVEDGIGARLVVDEKHTESAVIWLQEELGMSHKGKNNASRGAQKDKDIYMVGKLDDGTSFEVQISTARNIKKGESGIFDARTYKQKQKLLIQTRLFGSISKKNFDTVIKDLSQQTGTPAAVIRKEFLRYFFITRNRGRYYSYEHAGRMIDSPFMPEVVKGEMFVRLDLMSSKPPYELTLSDAEWQAMFETFCFPDRFANNPEVQTKILNFLTDPTSVAGLPKPLIAQLKILHEVATNGPAAKIAPYEDWVHIFTDKNIPPEDLEYKKNIIDYLENIKDLPFLRAVLLKKYQTEKTIK